MKDKVSIVLSLVAIIILILIALAFQGCALLKAIGLQTPLETYTFNYDGKDYSALLPEQVPMPPETAVQIPQSYWGIIYAMHVQYFAGKQPDPRLPTASFWFTPDLGVIGLAWHTLEPDGTIKDEGWLYVKGIPIGTTLELFNEMLEDLFTNPSTPGA